MSLDVMFKGRTDPIGQFVTKAWGVDDTPSGNEFVDLTLEAIEYGSDDAGLAMFTFAAAEANDDFFAVGQRVRFGKLYFYFGKNATAGVGGGVTFQYYNGAWTNLSGVVDGTSNFTSTDDVQEVSYTFPSDWTTVSINGGEALYYIRAIITSTYSTNPDYDGVRTSDHQPTYMEFAEVWGVDDTPTSNEFVDKTADANDQGDADFAPFNFSAAEAINDFCAVGMRQQFGRIRVDYANGTAGVGGTIAVEYWNGSVWGAVSGLTDNTTGFTASAADDLTIEFTVPGDWAKTSINAGEQLYYIRFRVTATYSTNPVLDQMFPLRANQLVPIYEQEVTRQPNDPIRNLSNSSFPTDFADEDPVATFICEQDCTMVGVTTSQENGGNISFEIVQDGTVVFTHVSTGAGEASSVTSVALNAGEAIYVRMLLTGGENPGEVTCTVRRSHVVTVSGAGIQALDVPDTLTEIANYAMMPFGASLTTANNYFQFLGNASATQQASRNQLSEGRAPITGTLWVVVTNANGDTSDFTVWVNDVDSGRFVAYLPGGDELDEYAIHKALNIAVTQGDRIAIEGEAVMGTSTVEAFIIPADGIQSGHQYYFGGDMRTATRGMEWMGTADSSERTLDTIRSTCSILYPGTVSQVILNREISGATYTLRRNDVNEGTQFSGAGVNNIAPVHFDAGDTLQLATTAGPAAQNRSTACVQLVPDDPTKTGFIVPFGGDPGVDFADTQWLVHSTVFTATGSTPSANRWTAFRDMRAKRIGGLSELGQLEVALGVHRTWLKVVGAGDFALGAGSFTDILPSENGLEIPRAEQMSISQILGGGDTSIQVYVE